MRPRALPSPAVRRLLSCLAALSLAAAAGAEPIFLARQYSRCTNCHYSPAGGGLLTPYGRSLSREELSTFGAHRGEGPRSREHEFLFGALGGALGPVDVGIALRPAHLEYSGRRSGSRDLLMYGGLTAALRTGGWTFYGELGRQGVEEAPRVASFEHWVSYKAAGGFGLRAGRFLPAYGVRFADHTGYNRSTLRLGNQRQVYGLEMSYSGERHLVQVSAGPGYADSIDERATRAFTASGRWQFDLRPKVALVASGLYRAKAPKDPANGGTGLALGISPFSRLSLWAQGDARFRQGSAGTAYTLHGDASYEVYRGVWLRLSPQLRTDYGATSAGFMRWSGGVELFPRTHWTAILNYYRDRDRRTDKVSRTFLAQLHLYL